MDPIPQMIIETPAAVRKGQLVVTLANAAELRAAIDQAERGLVAARDAMAPEPAPDPARQAKLAMLGAQVQELSKPAPVAPDTWTAAGPLSPEAAVLAESIKAGAPLVVAAEQELCECGHVAGAHHLNQILDELTYCNECTVDGCTAYHPAAPLATVTGLHPAPLTLLVDGEPVEAEQCPNFHPGTLEPCVGGLGHEPPCRAIAGGEWVPDSAVTA